MTQCVPHNTISGDDVYQCVNTGLGARVYTG